jgi:ribosomal RNA-processing protein 9
VKWNAKTYEKLHTFPGGRKGVKNFNGHTRSVLCLAISYDGQYLASGGQDKVINIWSVKEDKHIVQFTQHRDAVSVCTNIIPSLFFFNNMVLGPCFP